MFKETSPSTAPITQQEMETIIGPSVKVEGDFVTEGNIIVEGTVCGSIKTSKNLRIGSRSKIFANISADNALISGEVQGNIKVNGKLELTATARIFGDIKTDVLIIAAGCAFNGKCQMGDQKTKSARPDSAKQEKIALPDQEDSDEDQAKKIKK